MWHVPCSVLLLLLLCVPLGRAQLNATAGPLPIGNATAGNATAAVAPLPLPVPLPVAANLTAVAPAPAAPVVNLDPGPKAQLICPGVYLRYVINAFNSVPYPNGPAFAFDASLTVQNVGTLQLSDWGVSIQYKNSEQITKVVNLTLPSTATLPAAGASLLFGPPPGLGTLQTAFLSAGNTSQYAAYGGLQGVEVGALNVSEALPTSLTLVAAGYNCVAAPVVRPNLTDNEIRQCCTEASSAPAPPALVLPAGPSGCPGVTIDYTIANFSAIPGSTAGAYNFAANVAITNAGTKALTNFGLQFGYRNSEVISTLQNLAVAPPSTLPATGNSTIFYPSGLTTVVNASQLLPFRAALTGTELGATTPRAALPAFINLAQGGYTCNPANATFPNATTSVLRQCCLEAAEAAAVAAGGATCPGVLVDYQVLNLTFIPDPSGSAYSFVAAVTVSNIGSRILSPWALAFGYRNRELIYAAQGLVLPPATLLPTPGNGTVFSAPPTVPAVPNAVMVAGDTSKYTARATISGTEFGATTGRAALPGSITLVAPGYTCSPLDASYPIGTVGLMRQCCAEGLLPPAPAPLAAPTPCVGIQVDYTVDSLTSIPDPTGQAFAFKSTVVVANVGSRALPNYNLRLDWANNEIVTDTDLGVNGQDLLPKRGNETQFRSPDTKPYLFTAVEAAGNASLYTTVGHISGTEIGALTPRAAAVSGIHLDIPNYNCDPRNFSFLNTTGPTVRQCCTETPLPPAPAPAPASAFQVQEGITIQWDVIKSNASEYTVRIKAQNQKRYTTIKGGWLVGWIWQAGEFIWSVENGVVLEFGDCRSAQAANDFPGFQDLVGSCSNTPKIIDSTDHGGVLTGQAIDIGNSSANFTVRVGKPRRNWPIATIFVPQNFTVGLPGWACNPPVLVKGRQVPFSSTSLQVYDAYASYNITCGPTSPLPPLPKCCVSMTAFFNRTIAPCKSCVCGGCGLKPLTVPGAPGAAPSSLTTLAATQPTCNLNSSSLKTAASVIDLGVAQAGYTVPGPSDGRCDDTCPINLHFDIQFEYQGGWKTQIAFANRNPFKIPDWMVVMEFPLLDYLQSVFSVQYRRDEGASRPTEIFSGFQGYNDLLLAANSAGPGNVAWVMLFNKTGNATQGIFRQPVAPLTVINELAFPTRVWINGDECAMPDPSTIPIISGAAKAGTGYVAGLILCLLAAAVML